MKKGWTLEAYQRVGDAAGVMVLTLLAYRKAIHDALKRADALKKRGKPLTKAEQLYVRLVERGKDAPVLDKLEKAFAGRAPVAFTDVATCFFHSIFPPVQEPPSDVHTKVIVLPRISSIIIRAGELIQFPRFIRDAPQSWAPESRFFKKMDLYAEQLAKRSDFKNDVSNLRKRFRSQFVIRKAPFLDDPSTSTTLDTPDHELAVLCMRYCLLGVTGRFVPIPRPVQLSRRADNVCIMVPNYMEFNWRDDLPGDVFKFLQHRVDIAYDTVPQRLAKQDRPTNDSLDDASLRQDYCKLVSAGLSGNKLWDELIDLHPWVTRSDDPENRRKIVRGRVSRLVARLKI